MKGGGGGCESSMRTKSWCSNCRRLSAMIVSAAPSSPSSTLSARGGNSLLKVAMSLAMLVLLFSIYQTCAPSRESSLPLWLSLSSVSRPSLISSPELSIQPQERPTSHLVESVPPMPLDDKHSSLFSEDLSSNSSGQETGPSDVKTSDDNNGKRHTIKAHNGNLSTLQPAPELGDSVLTVTEKDLPQDLLQRPFQGTNTSDVGSSSMEKVLPVETVGLVEDPQQDPQQGSNLNDLSSSSPVDRMEFKEGETMVVSGTASIEEGNMNSTDSLSSSVEKAELKETESVELSETIWRDISSPSSSSVEEDELKQRGTMIITETISDESAMDGETRGGKISEELGVENEQPAGVVLSNSYLESKPERDAVLESDSSAVGDDASAHAPASAASHVELEIPSHITEKPVDERRVKLEEQLYAAKQAIEGATLADKDPSLYGVIYNNVSAFSKSYKLMEELFKIYVYKEGNPPLVHTGPLLGIYASEGRFLDRVSKGSPFIVEDPALAHMFYLPYSVTEMTLTIYVEGSSSMQPLNDFIKEYVDDVAAKYPFWNRTRGADHFFVSCHDWGPATARDHEELRKNAVKVLCNADLNEEFVLGRDVSLPEIYLHYTNKPLKVGGPGAVRRSFLAFFAGQMHGHVRPVLIEHWKDKDPDMKIYEVLPKAMERKMNYIQHMKNSKYCICAAGFEVNSPRIVESIYYDCVPVIIADNFILPFSDILNWSTFSVTIPESEIPNLKSILLSISDRQYRAMQKRLSTVRQHFLWHEEPVKYDVFHMIMYSVWMSRLNSLTSQK